MRWRIIGAPIFIPHLSMDIFAERGSCLSTIKQRSFGTKSAQLTSIITLQICKKLRNRHFHYLYFIKKTKAPLQHFHMYTNFLLPNRQSILELDTCSCISVHECVSHFIQLHCNDTEKKNYLQNSAALRQVHEATFHLCIWAQLRSS